MSWSVISFAMLLLRTSRVKHIKERPTRKDHLEAKNEQELSIKERPKRKGCPPT